MHITLETDYAVRIIDALARQEGRVGAKSIAERAHVTLRFSLKILRKLVTNGIVRSYKGAQGGYEIARPLAEITLNDILETIEGPYTFSRCLHKPEDCSLAKERDCPYRPLFRNISDQVTVQLKAVNIAEVLAGKA